MEKAFVAVVVVVVVLVLFGALFPYHAATAAAPAGAPVPLAPSYPAGSPSNSKT
jgi:hypothetical protein